MSLSLIVSYILPTNVPPAEANSGTIMVRMQNLQPVSFYVHLWNFYHIFVLPSFVIYKQDQIILLLFHDVNLLMVFFQTLKKQWMVKSQCFLLIFLILLHFLLHNQLVDRLFYAFLHYQLICHLHHEYVLIVVFYFQE